MPRQRAIAGPSTAPPGSTFHDGGIYFLRRRDLLSTTQGSLSTTPGFTIHNAGITILSRPGRDIGGIRLHQRPRAIPGQDGSDPS